LLRASPTTNFSKVPPKPYLGNDQRKNNFQQYLK
jgi:hypothetical protein